MDDTKMSVEEALKVLIEFNKWRRGYVPYGWSEEPEKNLQMPYTPTDIGKALDVAISVLGEKTNEAIFDK